MPPLPIGGAPKPPLLDRIMDNRPARMLKKGSNERIGFVDPQDTPKDKQRKKSHLWISSMNIMVNDTLSISPPMPLDVDNGFPGIEVCFGISSENEFGYMCHIDTCAAMNTGDLLVHQWLMTIHPHFVTEFIHYDDRKPFEPLQLHCAVEDLVKTESLHGKLTAIVRYWLRYEYSGKKLYYLLDSV